MQSDHPGPDSDCELWARVRTGDHDAFETLYRRHVTAVYRYCYSRCGGVRGVGDVAARAEDLTAEVFLTTWRRRRTLQVEVSLRPLLLAVAARLANNSTRGEIRRLRLLSRLQRLRDSRSMPLPEDTTIHRDLERRVERAIDLLPPGLGTVARLCILQDRSTGQVAQILQLAEGTVKSRLHRAREVLRRQLVSTTVRPQPR